jgi:hypothetical protein
MGEDEHRHAEGRLIPPPALPGLVPRPGPAAEHPSPHDHGAGVRERLLGDLVVAVGLPAAPPVAFLEGPQPIDPLVQALATLAERCLGARVRAGDEAVQ